MTREEALKRIQHLFNTGRWDFVCSIDKDAIRFAYKVLENQKIGHWIETTLANGRKGMKCSNCGREPIEDSLYGYVYSDYCPNCGAKMEGE